MTISDGCMGQGHVSRALANVVLPMFWQENRQKRPLSRGEFDAMGIDIDRAKLYLKMVNDRLQLAYGDVERLGLEHLIYADVGQARRWRQQNRRER